MNILAFFTFFIANILFITLNIEKYTIIIFFYRTCIFFIGTLFITYLILNSLKFPQTRIDKYILLIIIIGLIINLVRYLNNSYTISILFIYAVLVIFFVYSSILLLLTTYNIKTVVWLLLTAYIIINCTKDVYRIFTNTYLRLFISIFFYVLLMTIIAAIFIPNTFQLVSYIEYKNLNISEDVFLLKIFIKSLINNYTLHDITFSSSVNNDFLCILQYVLSRIVDLIFLGLIFKFVENFFDSK